MSPEVQSRGISDSKETYVSQKLKTTNTESHTLDLKGRKKLPKQQFWVCYSPTCSETVQGQAFATASIPPTILFLFSEITTGGIADCPQTMSDKQIFFKYYSFCVVHGEIFRCLNFK